MMAPCETATSATLPPPSMTHAGGDTCTAQPRVKLPATAVRSRSVGAVVPRDAASSTVPLHLRMGRSESCAHSIPPSPRLRTA